MSNFSDAQVMLTLSLLSYRGFWKTGTDGEEKQKRLARDVADGLDKLPTLNGEWKLIWGPASYRYLGSLFDSSMMYVVQNTKNPSRIAIVVRGTNPIALSDWLLGDFLSHRQVPWHYGDNSLAPNARVSLSTALGLKILLSKRCVLEADLLPRAKMFSFLNDLVSSDTPDAATRGIFTEQKSSDDEETVTNRLLARLIKSLVRYQEFWVATSQTTETLAYKIGNFLPTNQVVRIFSMRRRLIQLLDLALDVYTDVPVGILMPDVDPNNADEEEGAGLLELLATLAEEHGDKLEIFVTGHSKGGALAPALALFLHDTQNNLVAVPDQYQWNPNADASIYCYDFAGPTPGNDRFAYYFNKQLGKNFYRYNNMNDFASFAWTDDFRRTATLYDDVVETVPGLQSLVEEVVDDMKMLDYWHLGRDYNVRKWLKKTTEQHVFLFHGKINPELNTFTQQWLYQHIDAYMEELGLSEIMSVEDIIGVELVDEDSD